MHRRPKHDKVTFLKRFVRRARKWNSRPCSCGKVLPGGLYLSGGGITLADMARDAGMTLAKIKEEIRSKDWVCRGCLNACRNGTREVRELTFQEQGAIIEEKAYRNDVHREAIGKDDPQWVVAMEAKFGPLKK